MTAAPLERIWKPLAQCAIGIAVGLLVLWALVDVGHWFARDVLKPAVAKPLPAKDAEPLCAAYGGVREVASKTYTVRAGVEETGIAAYCNDGSYVARYTK